MATADTFPTPYPDINAVLHRFLADVQALLADRFVGLYLHGSLATGGFNPARSDVDFVVVTTSDLPPEMLPALRAMHARLAASGLKWAAKLEGSYIPQQAIRRYDPARALHPAVGAEGSLALDHHSSDWVIQYHIIREHGIAVSGPSPKALIEPVGPADLRRAALGILREWWAPQLEDHSRLCSREYQAYAALTMCRILYTLEHGTVVPKEVAARWAVEIPLERWRTTVDRALAWPRGPQPDALDETLALIRKTLECAEPPALPPQGRGEAS